jgi:hypothetical protein
MISSVCWGFLLWQKGDCQFVLAVSNTIFSTTEVFMKLRKWLDQQGLTNREFARMIDASEAAVSRWMAADEDRRIPRPEYMASIQKATNGKVRAQDFYS